MASVFSGADVSYAQGAINWTDYGAAKDFVIIKAAGADDGLYTDSRFSFNQTNARAQSGLRIGYYFFGSKDVDPTSAANYFISVVGTLNNGEILFLDIENEAGNTTPDDGWAFTFCSTVNTNYGFDMFVYMSQFSPTSSALDWPTTNPIAPFWMANYTLDASDFSETTGNADSTWGSLPAPNYRVLQFTDAGSVSGIVGNVDLDSFYAPNGVITDWDALGFNGGGPPPPTHGIWTQIPPFDVTPVFTQPLQQTISVPQFDYDKVIYSTTWSDSVSSNSWPINRIGPTTNTNQTCYPVGNYLFTLDGTGNGAFNDFGFIYSTQGVGTFIGSIPPVVIQPIVGDDGTLSFDVSVTDPVGTQTVDYTVHVALLVSNTPQPMVLPSVTQSIAEANLVPNIMPAYAAYRRIAIDSKITGNGSFTIAHGQNGIPNVIAFPQDSTGDTFINPSTWSDVGNIINAFGLSMDDTNLYFFIDSSLTGAFYRVYVDN